MIPIPAGGTLLAVDAVPSYVTTLAPDWAFTQQDLESAVTSKTKGILVCTPSNPTGKVFTRAELGMIADFAVSHDLLKSTFRPGISEKGELLAAGRLLGLFDQDPDAWFGLDTVDEALRAEIDQLLAERLAARQAKDFEKADAIREILNAKNVQVDDGPEGATWRLKD